MAADKAARDKNTCLAQFCPPSSQATQRPKLASVAHPSHLFVLRMTQIGQTHIIPHMPLHHGQGHHHNHDHHHHHYDHHGQYDHCLKTKPAAHSYLAADSAGEERSKHCIPQLFLHSSFSGHHQSHLKNHHRDHLKEECCHHIPSNKRRKK